MLKLYTNPDIKKNKNFIVDPNYLYKIKSDSIAPCVSLTINGEIKDSPVKISEMKVQQNAAFLYLLNIAREQNISSKIIKGAIDDQLSGINEERYWKKQQDDIKDGGNDTGRWFELDDNNYYYANSGECARNSEVVKRLYEVMDFALRRRFIWKEIKVPENIAEVLQDMFKMEEGLKDKDTDFIKDFAESIAKYIEFVNDKIKARPGLNEQYCISQGQFANIPSGDAETTAETYIKQVWDLRLRSLLYEYVRGEV